MATSATMPSPSPWRVCVAPMMDWTDRHCRHLHRLLTRRARLYTEMVNAGAVVHGGTHRHLHYHTDEHPLALQLGGSEPTLLAQASRLAVSYGYDEINLNCGCPSPRVQRGAFGACLMREPALVADCVRAMQDAAGAVPVTVKHRIGVNQQENYTFVRDFVGQVALAGCRVFIVHARSAWLQGLSPKQNREIPPLRYNTAYQLKKDFPDLTFVLNGGIAEQAAIAHHLEQIDGVMIGRHAYHHPMTLATWDAAFFGEPARPLSDEAVEASMVEYMARCAAQEGAPWSTMARHMLGLFHGARGARLWRQVWSDHHLREKPVQEVARLARLARLSDHSEQR